MKDKSGNDIIELQIYVGGEHTVKFRYRPESKPSAEPLTDEQILAIVRAAVANKIHRFRLYGDDTLQRKGIVELTAKIKAVEGVERLSFSTNGSGLTELAPKLREAGADDVYIQLDTLKYTAYGKLVEGGEIDDIIPGINACVDAGLSPVTLNVHIFKGINDNELMDFLQLTFQHRYNIIFNEIKDGSFGEFNSLTEDEIKAKMPALRTTLKEGETVNCGETEFFKYPIGVGKIGFISPKSYPEKAGAGIAIVDENAVLKKSPFDEEGIALAGTDFDEKAVTAIMKS